MKGSTIRRAQMRDAEDLCQLYQASIRGLGSSHYTPEQVERWANRPIEAFAQDIQNTLVLVCDFENQIVGYAQFELQTASVSAVYVLPDYARRRVGSLLFCFLECDASSDDMPRLSANVSLNAVDFFRAQGYDELDPTLIPLADGTSLPGVKMELACLEVGDRGGAGSAAALFRMLDHPQWHARLEACKALITQKTADQRVISTLEAMSKEPEAAIYDAECEDNEEMLKSMMEAFGHGDKMDQCWGKLQTIIRRAQNVIDPADSHN